jgi:hypothetical protein
VPLSASTVTPPLPDVIDEPVLVTEAEDDLPLLKPFSALALVFELERLIFRGGDLDTAVGERIWSPLE